MAAVAQSLPAEAPVLEIRDLVKSFGAVEVLRSLNVGMARGDLVLVGPSGCGKSTLLNCIAGLDEVTGGAIVNGGRDVTKVPRAIATSPWCSRATRSPDDDRRRGTRLRHEVRRVPREVQEKKVEEVAKLLQISHLLERKPGALRQASARRHGPCAGSEPVLFSSTNRFPISMRSYASRCAARSSGCTRLTASIVYVTHDQIEAMTLGTRIVVQPGSSSRSARQPRSTRHRPISSSLISWARRR